MNPEKEYRHLDSDEEPGTLVEVQSETNPDRFYEGYVDDEGEVRDTSNGTIFVAENYAIVGVKDGELDIDHSMGLSGGDD